MPTTGEKVKIVSTAQDQFNIALQEESLDDNTIYFVSDADFNSIWVGSNLYATGIPADELSNWIQIEHYAIDVEYNNLSMHHYLIEDWNDTLYNTVFIGGIYVNGLRSTTEFTVDNIYYINTEEYVDYMNEHYSGDNENGRGTSESTRDVDDPEEDPSDDSESNDEPTVTTYTPLIEYSTEISYTNSVELVIDVYRIKFKEPMSSNDATPMSFWESSPSDIA